MNTEKVPCADDGQEDAAIKKGLISLTMITFSRLVRTSDSLKETKSET